MAVPANLAASFRGTVRQRGLDYLNRGRVRILTSEPGLIAAEVRGGRRYGVRLIKEEDAIVADCECPFLENYAGPCKHIWAVLLAAERNGILWDGGHGLDGVVVAEDRLTGDSDWIEGLEDAENDEASGFIDEPARPRVINPPARTGWKNLLRGLAAIQAAKGGNLPLAFAAGVEIQYVLDVPATVQAQALRVSVLRRSRRRDGSWGKLQPLSLTFEQAAELPDPADRRVLALFRGAPAPYAYWAYGSDHLKVPTPATIAVSAAPFVVEQLCATGRCFVQRETDAQAQPIHWDAGEAWQFRMVVRPAPDGGGYEADGVLKRGGETMSLTEAHLVMTGGVVVAGGCAALLDDGGAFPLLSYFRSEGRLRIRHKETDTFLEALHSLPLRPPVDLPQELCIEEVRVEPRPRIKILKPRSTWDRDTLQAEVSFDYGGLVVAASDAAAMNFDAGRRRLVVRDRDAEERAAELLAGLGFRKSRLKSRKLPSVVPTLLEAGWHVEAEGKVYREASGVSVRVTSGVDWFDVEGEASYGELAVPLADVLAALARGERTIPLGDGALGMLPEDWLRKFGALADLGKAEHRSVRFSRTQVGLLDALLASLPEASCDEVFARARERLRAFEGIREADPPASFRGTLRPYQRAGLGWLRFLREFGFGGCLADDMGLGKTVQVLALLEAQRVARGRRKPSLVVAPRSLILNWIDEARRFAPSLALLDHTGLDRARDAASFREYDLVLTTYGTLRRDAAMLHKMDFDTVVLDESQAVKNDRTDTAKAVRLLRAEHRLALSGTPIENHLGELWSLFEFLNPGMLGTSAAFRRAQRAADDSQGEGRALLARAVRPFLLRRTKQQVARDLPARTEQTLSCPLEGQQRALYGELRDHYRRTLLAQVDRAGLAKSKMHVLEALLRLRQAACHPGLIDPRRTGDGSAKLDLLLPQLAQVVEEGNKALVFSQFTSFLAIVRARLDAERVRYAYIDGTLGARKRQEAVTRFQGEPECRIFLVSLKAGGLGLNLTAAEYVYLLDPWWNPAVEAQAIDRAHRIGQTKPVIAYRLVAAQTVEERILELQARKKELADAILGADSSVLRDITRDDLELLLS